MKKVILYVTLFLALVLFLPGLSPGSDALKETRLTGTLHQGSTPFQVQPPGPAGQPQPVLPEKDGYWLKSDTLVYVAKGSKSQSSTDVVVLRVPAELRDGAMKLKNVRVFVAGTVKCSGHWRTGAYCDMVVSRIGKEKNE